MKTLYILRHAQKDESNPEQYDYDIPLTKKGEVDSLELGQKLKEKGILPDLIVSIQQLGLDKQHKLFVILLI